MSVAFVAVASLRRHARAHHAGFAADRFADARVHRSVTVIAGACPRRRARPENARLVALRPAFEGLVGLHLEAVRTQRADVRGYATTVGARTIADGLAHKRRGVVAGSPVTRTARAHIRLGAVAVISLAFRVANGPTGKSVRVHPVAFVAIANFRIDTSTVDTAVRAFRHA